MPKFNAQAAIEPIEYDLSPWGPVGALPEPSQGQVEQFFDRIRELRTFAGKMLSDAEKLAKEEKAGELQEFAENLPVEEIKEYQHNMAPWLSEVASGSLDVGMLRELPYRVFGAFFKYITKELSPKEETD